MLRSGHVIQLAVLGMLGLGVLMVHSASLAVGGPPATLSSLLLNRHAAYALVAVLAMLLASRVNVRHVLLTRTWLNPLPWLTLVAILLVVIAMLPGVGVTINGARRWLWLGPRSLGFTFQPSEMLKWLIVLCVATWCARRSGAMPKFWSGLLPILMLVGLACVVVVREDLGTAVLMAGASFALMLAAGARWWQLGALVPLAGGALGAAVVVTPYRVQRLVTFLNPFADPRGTGYQAIQSMLALADGGLTGKGLGNGVQKFGYLPADTSDFLFAVICEELGLAGAGLVVLGYMAILWAGLSIVRECRDVLGRLVALGILLMVGLQALMNIAVVTVVVPTKGIALPLLSAGGTGWIMTAFCLGLVAALDNANALEAEPQTAPRFGLRETMIASAP